MARSVKHFAMEGIHDQFEVLKKLLEKHIHFKHGKTPLAKL